MASATPCTTRPASAASPQSSEAAMNEPTPHRSTRLRPKASPSSSG
jgi:hypothetical protein